MFKKRTTITENMSYFALMAGINVIFVLLGSLFPPLLFLLLFLLPLCNCVVTIFCNKKYYLIYALVTLSLCILVTFSFSLFDTFLYVLPSLITGFIFGIFIEKEIPSIHTIVVTTIIQYLLTLLTFIIISQLFNGVDFFESFFSMFGLSDFGFKAVFIYVFSFLTASIQMLFSYVIIKIEIRKLQIKINLDLRYPLLTNVISFISILGAIIFYFLYAPLVYIFIFIGLYYFVYQILILSFTKSKLLIVSECLIILISLFIFAGLYSFPIKPLSIILLTIPFGLINIEHLIKVSLIK